MPKGAVYVFNNNQSSGAITVNNNSNTLIVSIPSGGYAQVELTDNSIAAGSWDRHFQAPSNVSWSTNTFDYAGSITSATWNGNVVQPNRGGTGQSTYTDGQLLIGNSTGNTLSKANLSAGTGIAITNGAGSISIASTITQYTDALARAAISLTTTGSNGSATYNSSTGVLNVPTYTLSGLGGQPLAGNLTALAGLSYSSLGFIKMTGVGTLALDTNSYYLASNPNSYTANLGTVTSVAALTLGTTGTDLSSSVATGTTTPVITLNVPTASATNRGVLSSSDWTTFNGKQAALSGTGFVKISGTTISYDNSTYALDSSVVHNTGNETIAGQKTFSSTIYGTSAVLSGTVGASYVSISGASGTNALYITHNSSFNSLVVSQSGAGAAIYATGNVSVVGTGYFSSSLTAASLSSTSGYNYTLPSASGTLALTSNLSSYLPLSGGTLTGALSGTSATFSDIVSITANNSTAYSLNLLGRSADNATTLNFFSNNGVTRYGFIYTEPTNMQFGVNGAVRFSIASTGAATFASSVTASKLVVDGASNSNISQFALTRTDSSWGLFNETDLRFYQSNSNTSSPSSVKMVITSAGSVGIGTSSLQQTAANRTVTTINGTSSAILNLATSDTLRTYLYADSSGSTFETVGTNTISASGANVIAMNTNGSERMRITSTGYVATNANTALQNPPYLQGMSFGWNKSNGQGEAMINWSNAGGGTNPDITFNYWNNSTLSERMRITSGGAVCIGTTSAIAGAPLGVLSTSASQQAISIWNNATSGTRYFIEFSSGSTYTAVGSITYNGTTTSYNMTSDYRLKEDLKSINGLEIVNKIKVYDYKWKSSDNRMDGVLAHELADVLPYAVTGIKDGDRMQSVDYSKIVPVMVQAIKELTEKVKILENK